MLVLALCLVYMSIGCVSFSADRGNDLAYATGCVSVCAHVCLCVTLSINAQTDRIGFCFEVTIGHLLCI